MSWGVIGWFSCRVSRGESLPAPEISTPGFGTPGSSSHSDWWSPGGAFPTARRAILPTMPDAPPPTLRLRLDREALASNWRALDRLSGSAEAGPAVKADCYGLCVDTTSEEGWVGKKGVQTW